MKKQLNMYVPVRDETNFMIKYYQYLFNKYWGKHVQVYFLGYKKPDVNFDSNIHFVSLAESRAPDPTSWSTPIVDYFEKIDDEFFYFSLEDMLIIRPVDLELLESCKSFLNQSVGRIDLWNSVQYDPGRRGWVSSWGEHEGVKMLKQSQNPPPSVYRVSCSNSIWNRQWFLKTLERGWSPYDWETKANDGRNNKDGCDVYSTVDRWTPTVVHSLCKHWSGKVNLYGMLPEDREKMYALSAPKERMNFTDIVDRPTVVNLSFSDPLRQNVDGIFPNCEGYQPNSFDISNIVSAG